MSTYLHGWRRKLGVITLVMACAFMGAWIRGLGYLDTVVFPDFIFFNEHSIRMVGSSQMGIEWRRDTYLQEEMTHGTFWPIYHSIAHSKNNRSPREDWFSEYTLTRNWDFCGLIVDEGYSDSELVTYWVIPYWSVVVPLTLLSAYLLLVKPRAKTSTTEST